MKTVLGEAKEIINILIEVEYKIQLKPVRYQEALNHFKTLLMGGESKKEILARYLKMFKEFPCSWRFLKHDLIRFVDSYQANLEMKEEKLEEGYLCFRPGSKFDRGFIYSFKNASNPMHIDYQVRYPEKYKDPILLCFFIPDSADEIQNLLFYAKGAAWPFIKAALDTPFSEHELKALLSLETLTSLRTDRNFIGSAEQIKAFIAPEEEKCRAQKWDKAWRDLRFVQFYSPSPGEPLSPGVRIPAPDESSFPRVTGIPEFKIL